MTTPMNTPASSKRLLPGFVLFVLCFVSCLCVVRILAPQGFGIIAPYLSWGASIGIADVSGSTAAQQLLISDLILVGVALWLSSLNQRPIWSEWQWVKKNDRWLKWARSEWMLVVVRFAMTLGVLVALQWIERSHNYAGSVVLFLFLTGVISLRLFRDIVARRKVGLAKSTGSLPETKTRVMVERVMLMAWAAWLSSGVINLVGYLPPFRFSIASNHGVFGSAMDVKLAFFCVASLIFCIAVGFEASERVRNSRKQRRVHALPKIPLPQEPVEFGRQFATALAKVVSRATMDGARHVSYLPVEFFKTAWQKVGTKEWLMPFGFEFGRVMAVWALVFASFKVAPHIITYLQSASSWVFIWNELLVIGLCSSVILTALLFVTVRTTEDMELGRFYGRLLPILWAFPAAGLWDWTTHMISSETFPAFAVPGVIATIGALLAMAAPLYDFQNRKLNLKGGMTPRVLADKIGITQFEMVASFSERRHSWPGHDVYIRPHVLRDMATAHGMLVKYRKNPFTLNSPSAEELAKCIDIPVSTIIAQMEAFGSLNVNAKTILSYSWVSSLFEVNGFEKPAPPKLTVQTPIRAA